MPKDKYEGLIEEKVEQSVIGSVLIDGDSIKEVADFLKPDHFYKEANGNAPQDIDLIIVKNRYNPPRTIPLIFNGEFSTFTEK